MLNPIIPVNSNVRISLWYQAMLSAIGAVLSCLVFSWTTGPSQYAIQPLYATIYLIMSSNSAFLCLMEMPGAIFLEVFLLFGIGAIVQVQCDGVCISDNLFLTPQCLIWNLVIGLFIAAWAAAAVSLVQFWQSRKIKLGDAC